MQDRKHPTPNVFLPGFLDRLAARDQPPATEADSAGPWRVEPVPDGWAVVAEGGGEPEARVIERETALLAAAALPASGRPSRFLLGDAERRPFPLLDRAGPLRPETATPVGRVAWFHQELIEAMNVLDGVLRSPVSFAFLLEAAGHATLVRTGRVLAERLQVGTEGAAPLREPETG